MPFGEFVNFSHGPGFSGRDRVVSEPALTVGKAIGSDDVLKIFIKGGKYVLKINNAKYLSFTDMVHFYATSPADLLGWASLL